MAVLVQIPDNPNCQALDAQVFQCRTPARNVLRVRLEHEGRNDWCAITGIDEAGDPCPAVACIIEDSGDGACYLVTGGAWGLRMKPSATRPWSLEDREQWGEPFLLLGGDGVDLQFQD